MKTIKVYIIISLFSVILLAGCNTLKSQESSAKPINGQEQNKVAENNTINDSNNVDLEKLEQDGKQAKKDKEDNIEIEGKNEFYQDLLKKKWKFEDDNNWKLELDSDMVHIYIENSDWDTSFIYNMKEINTEEQYILLNIIKECEALEEGSSETEVNYFDKITINGTKLTYITRYNTDKETISKWILEE